LPCFEGNESKIYFDFHENDSSKILVGIIIQYPLQVEKSDDKKVLSYMILSSHCSDTPEGDIDSLYLALALRGDYLLSPMKVVPYFVNSNTEMKDRDKILYIHKAVKKT
jgi:hypothetical protein